MPVPAERPLRVERRAVGRRGAVGRAPVIAEAFADRVYEPDGRRLAPQPAAGVGTGPLWALVAAMAIALGGVACSLVIKGTQ